MKDEKMIVKTREIVMRGGEGIEFPAKQQYKARESDVTRLNTMTVEEQLEYIKSESSNLLFIENLEVQYLALRENPNLIYFIGEEDKEKLFDIYPELKL